MLRRLTAEIRLEMYFYLNTTSESLQHSSPCAFAASHLSCLKSLSQCGAVGSVGKASCLKSPREALSSLSVFVPPISSRTSFYTWLPAWLPECGELGTRRGFWSLDE